MAELVDARGSEPRACGREGSTPSLVTEVGEMKMGEPGLPIVKHDPGVELALSIYPQSILFQGHALLHYMGFHRKRR